MEESLVLNFRDARVMQVLAIHETALLREVSLKLRVIMGPTFVWRLFLRRELTSTLAAHVTFIKWLVLSSRACIICALSTVDAFTRVIYSILASKLVKFSLLKN